MIQFKGERAEKPLTAIPQCRALDFARRRRASGDEVRCGMALCGAATAIRMAGLSVLHVP